MIKSLKELKPIGIVLMIVLKKCGFRRKKKNKEFNMANLPVNQVVCGDCREVMRGFPNESIDLVFTSPPYGVGENYDGYLDSFDSLPKLLDETLKELKRIVVKDGRIAFNLPHSRVTDKGEVKAIIPSFMNSAENHGWNLREWIIWVKAIKNPTMFTAWGSWLSQSNPHLVIGGACESVLIYNKSGWKKNGSNPDLVKEEFIDWTNNAWVIKNVINKNLHCAPFPEELAYRIIKLYSFPNDIVLDSFVGKGTTCVVAKKLRRRFIGIDLNLNYVKTAQDWLSHTEKPLEAYI